MTALNGICLDFKSIPTIGFAHHFSMENYMQDMQNIKKPDLYDNEGIEIVYIKQGRIIVELWGEKYIAEPGSIMLVMRSLPLKFYAEDSAVRTHCSIEIRGQYNAKIIGTADSADKNSRCFLLPFINPPCKENEELKKKLFSVVSSVGAKGGEAYIADVSAVLAVLAELDAIYRARLYETSDKASIIEYKVKKYIADRIHTCVPIAEIAQHIGKSPNYLNSMFRESAGMGIHRYINKEKVRIISELILERKLPFGKACESVGIDDISYGYRMFKKHTGLTPRQYMESKRFCQ